MVQVPHCSGPVSLYQLLKKKVNKINRNICQKQYMGTLLYFAHGFLIVLGRFCMYGSLFTVPQPGRTLPSRRQRGPVLPGGGRGLCWGCTLQCSAGPLPESLLSEWKSVRCETLPSGHPLLLSKYAV